MSSHRVCNVQNLLRCSHLLADERPDVGKSLCQDGLDVVVCKIRTDDKVHRICTKNAPCRMVPALNVRGEGQVVPGDEPESTGEEPTDNQCSDVMARECFDSMHQE